ncbi:MAG: site-specific integrase [Pseudomonadota bacterium]
MDPSEQSRFEGLYAQHLRALRLQGKAPATIDGYARAVRRVAAHFDRCPDRLSADDYKAYFDALIARRSWSLVKIERCGLEFFHRHVLERDWPWLNMLKPPVVRSLPDVLTVDEIARLIAHTRERRYQTFWWVAYSMGLRLGEALNLRIGDIDAARGQVHVRAGKGRKDRFVVLPALTLACLRRYWREHRHPQLLFPSPGPTAGVMDRGSTQKAFARVVADCGIRKKVSIHSLRHAYATHLIEVGLNLRGVQELLGHACPKTTARYVHMTDHCREDRRVVIERLVARLRDVLCDVRGRS